MSIINHKKRLIVLTTISCLSTLLPSSMVVAQSSNQNDTDILDTSVEFKPPDLTGNGRPSKRRGAGSRDTSCQAVNPSETLVALIPETGVSLTTQNRPSLWFYIPYTANNFHSIEFSIQDPDQNFYQSTIIPNNQFPGVIKVELPAKLASLSPNQYYEWDLTLYCTESKEGEQKYVNGAVMLVTPNAQLQQELQSVATPEQKAIAYAKHGIWQDSLTILSELSQNNPQFQDEWAKLLTDVDLADLSDKKIVDCCNE